MTLFDFSSEQAVNQWHTENDVVMGGKSSSQIDHAPDENALRFTGDVSLENDGGFAQILFSEKTLDLSEYEGLELHVKGDNKTYQLRLEKDPEEAAYAHSFEATNTWQPIKLAFADLEATYHGEDVPDAPPLDLANINTLGILIGGGVEGTFELHIGAINAY